MTSRLPDNSTFVEPIYYSRLSSCGIEVFHEAIMTLSTLDSSEPLENVRSTSNQQSSKFSIERGMGDFPRMSVPTLFSKDTQFTTCSSSTQWNTNTNFTTSSGSAVPWMIHNVLSATLNNQIVGDHICNVPPLLTLPVGGYGAETASSAQETAAGVHGHAHISTFLSTSSSSMSDEWFDIFQSR